MSDGISFGPTEADKRAEMLRRLADAEVDASRAARQLATYERMVYNQRDTVAKADELCNALRKEAAAMLRHIEGADAPSEPDGFNREGETEAINAALDFYAPQPIPEPEQSVSASMLAAFLKLDGAATHDGGPIDFNDDDLIEVLTIDGGTSQEWGGFWRNPNPDPTLVAYRVVAKAVPVDAIEPAPTPEGEPYDASEFAESEADAGVWTQEELDEAQARAEKLAAELRWEEPTEAERAAAIELTADVELKSDAKAAIDALVDDMVGRLELSPDAVGTQTYMDGDQLVIREITADEYVNARPIQPKWNEPQPTEGYAPVVDHTEAHIQAVEAERYAQPTNPEADFWSRGLASDQKPQSRFNIFGIKPKVDA
jgi:hypothetical protein